MTSWDDIFNMFNNETNYEANNIHVNNATGCYENEKETQSNYYVDESSSFETDAVFKSRQDLIDWVQNTGRCHGYVIVIKNSRQNYNVVFQCDRGGVYRYIHPSTRDTGTVKSNCPFKVEGKYLPVDDCWQLKIKCGLHNHKPALDLEGHPYPRRLTVDETRIVEDLLNKNVKPKDILSALKKQNADNLSTLKTIYNAGEKIRRTEREGKSQMQFVMDLLHQNGYVYENRANALTNELEDLFFAHPTSLQIWQAFPHVLFMDATYNTNRYGMPLLEIVGVTSTNMTFSIAFVYMHKEKQTNYVWALECLKSVMNGCMSPRVIVTDRELALMNACNIVFPDAKGLLCRWHINNNLKKKCKACWNILYTSWNRLVKSVTEEAYKINLEEVENNLLTYPVELGYLHKVWLTPYKEKFVSAWTDKYLNFGNHTTNRVESQHAKLKKYFDSSQSDIAKSLKRIDDVVQSQYVAIKASLEHNKIMTLHRFNIPHFTQLCGFVSSYALDIVFKEYKRSTDVGFVFEKCGCLVRTSYGLPCAHEQAILVEKMTPIPLDLVDKFWKKLDLLECTSLEDDDFGCDAEINMFNAQFKSKSRSGKLSLRKKLLNIINPSTTSLCEPAVQKNTRGRPSSKHNFFKKTPIDLNQIPPTEDLPAEDPHMSSNFYYPSQEPETHNRYSFQEHSMYTSDPLMNEIPNEFHPYVTHIRNVAGDGNCGFRAIALSLGYNEDYWPQIRADLRNELLEHPIEYSMLYDTDFEYINNSLNFFGRRGAPIDKWLVMPTTSFLIANKYGVIVHFLSKLGGSSTCFPLWRGPQDISNHAAITIALVYGNHYVKVDLQEAHPMPTILPLWRGYKFSRAAAWETMYEERLHAYIPPHVPRNSYNNPVVDVSDN